MSNWWINPFQDEENEYEIVYTGMDFDMVKKDKKVDKPKNTCDHDWAKESFFTTKVYETCKKCGVKKEDL